MKQRIIIHNAVSLDGFTTGFEPDVRLYYELAGTWHEDATLAGADTLLAAAGGEDAGDEGGDGAGNRPLLVVPDSRGRIRNWKFWQRQPYWSRLVVLVSKATPPEYVRRLLDEEIAYIQSGEDHVDLGTAVRSLGRHYGAATIRVDSGGLLSTALLAENLVDEISLLIHPVLVGDSAARRFIVDRSDPSATRRGLHLLAAERCRNDVFWLRYAVDRSN